MHLGFTALSSIVFLIARFTACNIWDLIESAEQQVFSTDL